MNLGDILDGRYQLQTELGSGGAGRVFRAWDSELGRSVAIKAPLPEIARDPAAIQALKDEVRLSQALQHPNIVAVYEYRLHAGEPYILMEYLEGRLLRDLVYEQPGHRLDTSLFFSLARQILAAIAYAHAMGVVHRDLKPANVMVLGSGLVKVMDFGIAARVMEAASRATGRPIPLSIHYAAPEQIQGHPPHPSIDIYALGCVMYEMTTGAPPFVSGDVLHQHLQRIPEPPSGVAPALATLILRCLAKDPAARPQSVPHMLAQLEACCPEGAAADPRFVAPLATPSIRVPAPGRLPARRRLLALWAAVVGVAILLGGLLGALWTTRGGAGGAGGGGGGAPSASIEASRASPAGPEPQPMPGGGREDPLTPKAPARPTRSGGGPMAGPAPIDAGGPVGALALTPDGETVVAAVRPRGATRDRLLAWRISEPGRPWTLSTQGVGSQVTSVTFSGDGAHLAVASTGSRVQLWTVRGQQDWQPSAQVPGSLAVAFSPDSLTLAVYGGEDPIDQGIVLWTLASPPRYRTQLIRGMPRRVRALAFSPDGRRLAARDATGHLTVWTLPGTPQDLACPEAGGVAFAPDGAQLASHCGNEQAVWAGPSWSKRWTLPGSGALAFAPSGGLLAAHDGRGGIGLYALSPDGSAAPRLVRRLQGHNGAVMALAFARDRPILLSGSLDGQIRLWDLI